MSRRLTGASSGFVLRALALVSCVAVVALTAAVVAAPARRRLADYAVAQPCEACFEFAGGGDGPGRCRRDCRGGGRSRLRRLVSGRVPSVSTAFLSEDSSLALGAFTRKVTVFVQATTRRFCAYLQPAVLVANGDPEISPGAPLARAEIALSQAAAGSLRACQCPGSVAATGTAQARRSCWIAPAARS